LYHVTEKQTSQPSADITQAIIRHLERLGRGYHDIVPGKRPGLYKINYKVKGSPLVSIVIPNKDHVDDLKKLIQSIKKSTYGNYEIVIVENNSSDQRVFEYYNDISRESNVEIVNYGKGKFNYSSLVNLGVENSKGEYIVLINNDIEIITSSWIEELLGYAQRDDVGICGMKLIFPDRSIQHAGVTIGIRGLAGHRFRETTEKDSSENDDINIVQNLSAVTAACFMVRKNLYDELLGFDERLAVAFNDVDFCLKVRARGLLVIYNPFAEAYHYESKSRGLDDNPEKQQRFVNEFELFVRRWHKVLGNGDPYYNINLKLSSDSYEINYNKICYKR
jgi:GT2 family glycosyltransferase